jgi:hypothetical protein
MDNHIKKPKKITEDYVDIEYNSDTDEKYDSYDKYDSHTNYTTYKEKTNTYDIMKRIQLNMLKYTTDNCLPLCDYLTEESIEDFIKCLCN